ATSSHRNLDLSEHRFGTLELSERALLGLQRGRRRSARQLLLRRVHLGRGLGQDLRDLRPVAVLPRDAALHELVRQFTRLLTQALLRQAQRREVLVERLFVRLGAVARRLERRGDDLTLALRQLVRVVLLTPAPAATTAAALLLAVLVVRTNL